MKPYVFSNRLKLSPAQTLGVFSSHVAAFAAMMKLGDPSWEPLSGCWTDADQQELDRVRALLTAPSSAVTLPEIKPE